MPASWTGLGVWANFVRAKFALDWLHGLLRQRQWWARTVCPAYQPAGFVSVEGLDLLVFRKLRYNACTFNRFAVYVSRTVRCTANRKTLKTPLKTHSAEWRNGRRSGLKNLSKQERCRKFVIFPVFSAGSFAANHRMSQPRCTIPCTVNWRWRRRSDCHQGQRKTAASCPASRDASVS